MYEQKSNTPKVSFYRMISFGVKSIIKKSPLFFILYNLVCIISGVFIGVSVLVVQGFYDSVNKMQDVGGEISIVYLMIAALGFIYITGNVFKCVQAHMSNILISRAEGHINNMINAKASRIDPLFFEDTEFFNDFIKADSGTYAVIQLVIVLFLILMHYLPYYIFMGFYLGNIKPQFFFVIFLIFIPVALGQLIRTKIISKFEDRVAPVRREHNYYGWMITGREHFKETRKLGAFNFFMGNYLSVQKRLSNLEWQASKKNNLLYLCSGLVSATGYAVILYMLVVALLSEEISAGTFVAVFGSLGTMFEMVKWTVNNQIGSIANNMGLARNLIHFMELPERSGKDNAPNYDMGITADNISFTYPGSDRKSIENVSIDIKTGEMIAIVGENGAGKSTLVRLLLGLYKPESGKVILNGMDTAAANQKSLFNGVSGVFQQYQHYQMTLEENVRISDSDNDSQITQALDQAGVNLSDKCFSNGVSTMLSREFGGVDLSGGQWQRIAMARGLYRFHNVIVLDEPTAAIDPLEESRIYHKFADIAKNKTAIIVTHRLGSTKIADRVVVMDKGKIVDIGTHDKLMQRCVVYSYMFNSQAGWYEN